MSDGPVLVVGGTGMLGGQVVTELLTRGKQVRALVRPGSDASRLEAAGAQVARGDMLDPASLARAMDGADAVVTSAAGYTRHRKGDTSATDIVGNTNLVEAASRSGIRRFVLTSILTCDQTPQVPHFWHKKLAEDRLEKLGVPFVALRPGAFLDQITRFGGKTIRVRSVPTVMLRAAGTLLAPVNPMAKDLAAMIDWFQTGRYVADTTLQQQYFGAPPTAEDAVRRLVTGLGHSLR